MRNRNKFIKRDNSKAPTRFYTSNTDHATLYPNFNLDAVITLINTDPYARGCLTQYIDKCMEGDYAIVNKETLVYDADFERKLETEHNFRTRIIRVLFLTLKLFNNGFIEIVRDSENRVKSLNVLDASIIEPITKPNGDPISYRSTIHDPDTGEYPTWDAKEIIWVKYGDRSAGYAPVDLGALWETLQAKKYVRDYMTWLWKTGQYRAFYNFKNANSDDIPSFLAFMRRHDNDYTAPFIAKGEVEQRVVRDMKENDTIINLLKYYDNQITILLRVPPVDAGVPDSSGRSNADAQSNNFITSVTGFKKVVEDYISYELFPAMNKGTVVLRFAPTDRFAEKQVIENVQMMRGMGMTEKAIREYLNDRGMFFGTRTLFEKEEVDQSDNPRTNDNAPSRQGKGTGESNQAQSEVTTREDQVRQT